MNRKWKWLRSFFLRGWDLEDYPVRTRRWGNAWTAQVQGWWHMAGRGGSREEAWAQLRQRFDEHARAHPLPRPGAEVPIKLGTFNDDLGNP
jgi:hypothetical protein